MNIPGLSAAEKQILRQHLQPLADAGIALWLFGSRATGSYATYSDIDILAEYAGGHRHLVSTTLEALENSNLPYKVDLVLKEDLASAYRSRIYSEKRRLHLDK